MPSRLGANTNAEHAGSDRQKVADDLINMGAPFQLVLDDYIGNKWFFIRQLLARAKDTTPIHRRYWYKDPNNPSGGGWDGALHRADGISAWAIVSTLKAAQDAAGLRVMEQLYNEPDVHGDELRIKNKLIVDCIVLGAKYDMCFCVDNAQERSIWQSEIDAGYYDQLLITLAQFPKNVLGVHSYGLAFLPGNISNTAIKKLATVGAFPYEQWAVDTPAQITAQKAAFLANWRESHLCSGSVGLVKRARDVLKVAPPRIVKTEYAWDFVRLFDDGLITAQVQGLNDGAPPMGYPTLAAYWKKQFPYFTREEAAYYQLRWADVVEIPEVVGLQVYTIDKSFEQGKYDIYG